MVCFGAVSACCCAAAVLLLLSCCCAAHLPCVLIIRDARLYTVLCTRRHEGSRRGARCEGRGDNSLPARNHMF
ncbi:hypothetical protein E2C01_077584 [Portunus trituberculatus]|uniref:Secreted protein n=1 Tax=Portunus trituberculatus TaxID=210409 RepID=A0A5B7IMG8_PORTR|nr:hypothetical protein [Portunus trituberculatus]